MLAFCVVALLPLYGFGQVMVTMPIVLADLHGVSAGMWGILLVAYGASTAILQYPVVRILGRVDHMLLLALASLCIGVGTGSAAFVPWPFTFVCLLTISLGVVLLRPDLLDRGLASGSHGASRPLHGLLDAGVHRRVRARPALGGWALDALGGRGAFAAVAAAGLLGALLFPLLRIRTGPRDAAQDWTAATAALSEIPRGERPEQAV